ncbi:MAG: Kae1-associated serine/threonine protein kinase, partial [Candidatus Altiarchaeota archaeon]|nr:Kae1-associated serine/threonine protein kinase [Candidatus Altiarchaeota archaeon]
ELKNDRIVKKRIKKSYRHPDLDKRLRTERTKKESRLMEKASRAIKVPRILSVTGSEISMELIKGEQLKQLNTKEIVLQMKSIGELVGKLHSTRIAHNDLTGSNILISSGKPVLIDFGLSERGKLEDFAVDLHVFKESLGASHPGLVKAWPEFLKGYKQANITWMDVTARLSVVEKRGRYFKRVDQ